MSMVNMTIRVPKHLRRLIESAAMARGESVSEMIRSVLAVSSVDALESLGEEHLIYEGVLYDFRRVSEQIKKDRPDK